MEETYYVFILQMSGFNCESVIPVLDKTGENLREFYGVSEANKYVENIKTENIHVCVIPHSSINKWKMK